MQVKLNGNVCMDSYGSRHIGDVLQLQERRIPQLQQQSTTASATLLPTATGATPAPSRRSSVPPAPSAMPLPSTPSVPQVQATASPTPTVTATKTKEPRIPKKSQALEPKEIIQLKRKEVETAAGPS